MYLSSWRPPEDASRDNVGAYRPPLTDHTSPGLQTLNKLLPDIPNTIPNIMCSKKLQIAVLVQARLGLLQNFLRRRVDSSTRKVLLEAMACISHFLGKKSIINGVVGRTFFKTSPKIEGPAVNPHISRNSHTLSPRTSIKSETPNLPSEQEDSISHSPILAYVSITLTHSSILAFPQA